MKGFLIALIAGSAVSSAVAQQKPRILVGPNVLVSWMGGGTGDELHLATDPTNPKNLIGAGHFIRVREPIVSRGRKFSNPGDEGLYPWQEIRVYMSQDRGSSWQTVILPEFARWGGTDPQVAFGRTGTAVLVGVSDFGDSSVTAIYRSTDVGMNWSKPFILRGSDHEQITVDYGTSDYAGMMYMSASFHTDRPGVSHIGVTRSVDDGRTWTDWISVADNHDLPNRNFQTQTPGIFTDGELFIPFIEFRTDGPPSTATNPSRSANRFVTSMDGGVTFGPPQKLVGADGAEIATAAAFAIDNSMGPFRDRVYAVWPDYATSYMGFGKPPAVPRLWLSYSMDRGKTWQKPRQVAPNSPPKAEQRGHLMIAINMEGVVAISWDDTRDSRSDTDSLIVARYITASVDGGETFLPPVRVASVVSTLRGASNNVIGAEAENTSVSLVNGNLAHGDYYGLAADTEGPFHVFWVDSRTGSRQIWSAAVRVEQGEPEALPALTMADVTQMVKVVLEPLREGAADGTLELPIRLQNISNSAIYGPITVAVDTIAPNVVILNATNGKTGIGATVDYRSALGGFLSLPPGAISEGVVWRLKKPKAARGATFRLKVMARVPRTT